MVPSGPLQASMPIDPRELYRRCLKKEDELHRKGVYGLKAELLSTIAFGVVLPINLESAEKYRFLVEHLRKAVNGEARLQVVASWLKQEGICQPHEFLTKREFLDMTAPHMRACCAESYLPSYVMPTLWRTGGPILPH